MENAQIVYEIKFHVGIYAEVNPVFFVTDINEVEIYGLATLLIDANYLESWTNHHEFTIINRKILPNYEE